MKIVRRLLAFMLVFLLASTSFLSEGVIFADEEDYYEEELDDYGDEEEASVSKTNSIGDYRGLVAHWKFDGDLKDSSPFGNHGVAIGGKSGVTFVDGVLNKGVKLDGKSYIEVDDSDSLDLSDAFTISFWVYKDEMRKGDYMEGGVPYVIKYNDDNLPFSYGVYEWWHLIPSVSFYDGEEEHFINAGQQVDIQKWTLITATYDGKSVRIYHDKQLVKSELKSASIKNSSQPLHIGYAYFMVTDNFLKGVLDDMRIYNKALSYSEIEDLYDEVVSEKNPNAGKINKTKALIAYYKFNGDLKDSSGFDHHGIEISSKGGIKYEYAYAGKCAVLNGASYIEVQDSDWLDLDRGFTISAWIYKEKSDTNQPIVAKYGESHNKKLPSYILQDWYGREMVSLANFDSDGEIHEFSINDDVTSYGKWFYYTVTYKGSDGETTSKDDNTVKIYINGKLVSTQPFDGDISNSSGPLWIGADSISGTFFKGKIDELRIYNYALTQSEIKRDMDIKDTLTISPIKGNSLKVKATAKLKVTRLNVNDGKKEDVTSKASYTSSNKKVLTVSKGTVKAVAKGKANITATHGLISGSLKNITVK